jgi:hypothetical protein
MLSILRVSIAIVLSLGIAGCRSAQPRFFRPGSMQRQQYNATLHDPYADNDAGPEVVGGRPREFQKPLAEPVRSPLLRDMWWSR